MTAQLICGSYSRRLSDRCNVYLNGTRRLSKNVLLKRRPKLKGIGCSRLTRYFTLLNGCKKAKSEEFYDGSINLWVL